MNIRFSAKLLWAGETYYTMLLARLFSILIVQAAQSDILSEPPRSGVGSSGVGGF
jgi:hypothetical protein